MKNLKVTLIAKDFKDVIYTDPDDCALARAVRRTLGIRKKERIRINAEYFIVYDTKLKTYDVYRNGKFGILEFMAIKELMESNPDSTKTYTFKQLD